MKLCWDNINKLVLMPGLSSSTETRLICYKDPVNRIGNQGQFYESENKCLYCNETFLKKLNSKSEFCDHDCKKAYKNKIKEKRNKNKIDKRLKENGGGWQSKNRKSWNKGMKTGISKHNITYKGYKEKLEWFLEIRSDPEDGRILQTKCCICNSWYRPEKTSIKRILNFVNDKGTKQFWGTYCSDTCKNKCNYYNKSVEQIIKEDYKKSLVVDTRMIPNNILYYDWQQELKKEHDKLRKELKTSNKRKMRRRKKRESELQRIHKKKERNKYIETIEYKKEQYLKWMLYRSKQRAKTKGWEYSIDYKWLKENTPEKCPKCNIEFRYDNNIKMDPLAPSIDRIDNSKGYTKDNCIIVSWIYNCGKGPYNEEILYKICKAFNKQQLDKL